MSKIKDLYGEEETFQSLRDMGAINIYSHHKAMIEIQKKELLDRSDWTEPERQHLLNELDKGLKFWDNITRMVYHHAK